MDRLLEEAASLRAALEQERAASSKHLDGGEDAASALRSQISSYRRAAEAAEAEVVRLQGSVASLQEECLRWATMLDSQRTAQERATVEFDSRVDALKREVSNATEELSKRPTWADIQALRHQLAIVHAVAFNACNGDDGLAPSASPSSLESVPPLNPLMHVESVPTDSKSEELQVSTGSKNPGDVHSLLLRRIRQLETRLVHAEAGKTDSEAATAELRLQLQSAQDTVSDQAALIARLDDALSSRFVVSGHASSASAAVSNSEGTGATPIRSTPPTPLTSASLLSPQAQLESLFGQAAVKTTTSPLQSSNPLQHSVLSPAAYTDANSTAASGNAEILHILQDQRDRFRARVLDLEAECQSKAACLHDAQTQVAKITADNMKLYEKNKYLQSLVASSVSDGALGAAVSSQAAAAAASGTSSGMRIRGGNGVFSGATAATAAADEDFEKPYSRAYADSLDPFLDFSRREKARRYANLSAAEKITLTSSRVVLANKFARTAVFIYVLVMHVLVFATLWHFGHVSHRGCGDHADHFWDGATLGAPTGPAAAGRERLLERLMPNSLRGARGSSTPDSVAPLFAATLPSLQTGAIASGALDDSNSILGAVASVPVTLTGATPATLDEATSVTNAPIIRGPDSENIVPVTEFHSGVEHTAQT